MEEGIASNDDSNPKLVSPLYLKAKKLDNVESAPVEMEEGVNSNDDSKPKLVSP
jgi:hypothetical protein